MRWIRYEGWRVVEQIKERDLIRVRIRFDSEDGAVQLALAHGTDVELIEPTNLRRAVRDTATATAETYARQQNELPSNVRCWPRRGPGRGKLRLGRLKELHGVPRRVVEQHLRAAHAPHDVVP
jgi:hypothetical protein